MFISVNIKCIYSSIMVLISSHRTKIYISLFQAHNIVFGIVLAKQLNTVLTLFNCSCLKSLRLKYPSLLLHIDGGKAMDDMGSGESSL